MLRESIRFFLILNLIIAGLVYAGVRGYNYLYGDQNLLSMEVSLKYAEHDVLGKKLYGETCSRPFYSRQVEILSTEIDKSNNSGAGAFAFKFHPLPENEGTCPVVTIVVSRYTGEAWVTSIEKPTKNGGQI